MTVIARDAVARDHLVYAWPFPIGPDCEVSCADDEQVIMCPAWMVGDRLGPGRHHWRTPDPMRPAGAFFVSTGPVDCTFDMTTAFMIPNTGQPVRLRATGAIQVRCADAGLLIAQFVGLPFDAVNEGVLRSVSRSVERMLARLLTRRVVMAGTPIAVTDPSMLSQITEELVAYNPTAGAVFGIELLSMVSLVIGADDGQSAFVMLPNYEPEPEHTNGRSSQPEIEMASTAPGRAKSQASVSGEIGGKTKRHASVPPLDELVTEPKQSAAKTSDVSTSSSGEILVRPKGPVPAPPKLTPAGSQPPGLVEFPRSPDEITQPGVHTPVPGSLKAPIDDAPTAPLAAPKVRSSAPSIPPPIPAAALRPTPTPNPTTTTLRGVPAAADPKSSHGSAEESRGSIIGIGMSHIGSGSVAGEIPTKIAPGGRVLVPGPNGLMQSATVRQLLQGYYELEVGSSGETIWVPVGGVVPE